MTSPIPGYGAGLTDELILGHIAWYTITKPQLTHDDILELVTDLGLDANIVPKPPRAGDAFKRACRYSERNGIPVPYSENTANYMIRSVAQTMEEIERHLMLEIVDPNGRRLEYHKAAELKFNRKDSKLSVSVKKVSQDMDPITKETLDKFAAELSYATKYIEAQVIRRMIRQQLDNVHAVLARSKGSVYFVPNKYKDKLQALEEFTASCGEGSVFHTIPLIDTAKQQELIANAFNESVHDTATQIIVELQSFTDQQKSMTVNAWNDYKKKFDALVKKNNEYTELVDFELDKSTLELEVLQEHLNDFLLSGNIKLKGS